MISSPCNVYHRRSASCIICGLTRARKGDIESAAEALKGAARPRIHTGLGVSDVHILHKLRTTHERALEMGVEAVRYAKQFVDDVQYYTEDAGGQGQSTSTVCWRQDRRRCHRRQHLDTTGYTSPEEFGALIRGIVENVPNIDKAVISVHCHNDLGMATANTLAAVRNGGRQVEVTVNGIGERAGNASLEEVIMALKTRRDHFGVDVAIDTTRLYPISRLVSNLTGIMVQPNKAIIGSNAFAHSSGIHQDGVLKERTTYEIIDPKDVGVPDSAIILSARSGRHGLRHRLEELGYTLDEDSLRRSTGASSKWPTKRRRLRPGISKPSSPMKSRCSSKRHSTSTMCRCPVATTASLRRPFRSRDRMALYTAMPTTAPGQSMLSIAPSTG